MAMKALVLPRVLVTSTTLCSSLFPLAGSRLPVRFSNHGLLRVPSASISSTAAPSPRPVSPKQVLVPIGLGTEEIEAVVLVDILRRAGADVLVASVEPDLQVEASRRVKLVADEQIACCKGKDFDLIALPGGMPGAARLRDCKLLKEMTIAHDKKGKLVGAICAAPAVALKEWELLEGRKVTCHPGFMEKIDSFFSRDSRVQRDGHMTTSQGPGTALEFALSFVEQLYGKEKYDEVSKPLVLPSESDNKDTKSEFNQRKWIISGVPQVLVPIANGSEEMEAVIIIDVLRRAGTNVIVASVENALQVEASRKVKIVADKLVQDLEDSIFDLIVLPGGMPGAERLRNCEALMKLIRGQLEAQRPIGAICAAPAVILEANGLLKGKKATCYPAFVGKLSDSMAAESRVVLDGLSITSRGPGTALEFSLSIVEKFFGRERAMSVANAMVFKYS